MNTLCKELRILGGDFFAEYHYLHKGKRNHRTAYEKGDVAAIKITLPRSAGVNSLSLEIYDDSLGTLLCEVEGRLIHSLSSKEAYSFSIPTRRLGIGLYFMRLRASVLDFELYSHKAGDALRFDADASLYGMMQLTVSEFLYGVPEKILGGVIYHVFVDRFARGKDTAVPDGRRLISGEWENIPEYPEYRGAPLKNNTFYGGTLWGIIDRLDYIASLGVTAIYLSPISSSPSNHRYDTADYMTVDEMLGGDEALSALIKAADERGIGIILDGVFNHTGADSLYFNRYGRYGSSGAYQSRESEYFPWYDFKSYPNDYTSWWGIEILPRINPDIPECGEYLAGVGGVVDKYSKMGVYGFRLDVADELSDPFISKIKARLSDKGENILYGEVWEDASNKISYGRRKRYYLGSELDGVMNYPLREGIIDYVLTKSTDKLRYALTEVTENAPDRIMHAQMNLVGTHDTERILTVLGGEDTSGLSNSELCYKRMSEERRACAKKRLLAAATVLMTLPGVPAIFYGDEVGLEGYHDPFNRMPYPYGREDFEILEHYRALGNIRKDNTVYRSGDFELLILTPKLLVFSRSDGRESILTAFNNSDDEIIVDFSTAHTSLFSKTRAKSFTLSPMSADVFKANTKSKFLFRGNIK